MPRYYVALNTAEDGESQTVDVITLKGTKKQRIKAWRRYLLLRANVWDVHECNRIAKAMGFRELVK